MCGITGICDLTGALDLKQEAKRMNDILYHRGPDGDGFYFNDRLCLGHRRLSIIDLSTGSQPMANSDQSLWISFNGEIYNFQKLKSELQQLGYFFQTKSDTEVILYAYEQWGEKCLDKLRGMFAFCIWDKKRQQLFLARDRLGKKPIYYYKTGRRFFFASELKAILQVTGMQREMNLKALSEYFIYHYIPSPHTIFENIKKLPPAHCMTVKIKSDDRLSSRLEFKVYRYWELSFNSDIGMSLDDTIGQLEELLIEAVKIRLVSDVPLGAFLSGGIDSSAIVALMSRIQGQKIKTFSIGFSETKKSEIEYARIIAEKYNTDHHEMIVDPDAIDILPKLAWQFDEPFADSSAMPTYYVSKIARENVTVILSGDGGDEAFAGYSRYAHYKKFSWIEKMPAWFRKIVFGNLADFLPEGFRGKGSLYNLSRNSLERYGEVVTFAPRNFIADLFSPNLYSQLPKQYQSGSEHYGEYFGQYFYKDEQLDPLSRLMYLDINTYLPEDILTKVDRTSMLCSLETRAPLLDHKLLEFLATVPSHYKIQNNEKKFILKKVMEKYLPSKILYRPKMGFDLPVSEWFKSDFNVFFYDTLFSKKCRDRGYFDHNLIHKIFETHQKRGFDLSANLWSLLFFEIWCQNWLDSK